MGKNKLSKFEDMNRFENVFEYATFDESRTDHSLKGNWRKNYFRNDGPIILELGCGKGEYTVGMAERFPEKNFIGIDIKGARMWTGARYALEKGLGNVAFVRTHIEFITSIFAEGEVDEIWLTFPDPQMKKERKRLTSSRFLAMYEEILSEKGIVHLKTDSNFMFTYTSAIVAANCYPVLFGTNDLYHSELVDPILGIHTYYEEQWLSRGISIKYIKFALEKRACIIEPNIEIEPDSYRSFGRNRRIQL